MLRRQVKNWAIIDVMRILWPHQHKYEKKPFEKIVRIEWKKEDVVTLWVSIDSNVCRQSGILFGIRNSAVRLCVYFFFVVNHSFCVLFAFVIGRPIMNINTAETIDKVLNGSVTNEYQPLNGSYVDHAPQLTRAALIRVYVLVILGIISLVGNVAILFHIMKTRSIRRSSRHTWSAIYTLILHLSIADLLVTTFCIFGEASWSYTVEWIAGELACKLVKLFQMFALYLSTYVLVLIGIDRWVAVKYPMKSLNMAQRCYRLLIFSYFLSLIMSLPQVRFANFLFLRKIYLLSLSFPYFSNCMQFHTL